MNPIKHAPWLLAALAACGDTPVTDTPQDEAPAPTNRIDVPKAVRDNLGIEFATVERRRVAATRRYPGQFTLLPKARREYRSMLTGHVEIRVDLLQRVEHGDLLAVIDSPDWRARQRALGDLRTQIELDHKRIDALAPLLAAHEQHERSLATAIEVLQQRLGELELTRSEVGGLAAEIAAANVELARLQAAAAEAAEQHTATATRLVELRANITAGEERFGLAVAAAATITGLSAEQLRERWRELDRVEVRATAAGAVDVAAAGDLMLDVIDPNQLRFRAHAPQHELAIMQDGARVEVVPARGDGTAIEGTLQIGLEVDVKLRMAELFVAIDTPPAWARPGLAAFVEIETLVGGDEEIAIPRSALQRDGLIHVFFRRDSKDPDKVIRVPADLGADDGHWVEIRSDLTDGDEVVVTGAYELMLASSDSTPKGGHFHADGTWHPDEHK